MPFSKRSYLCSSMLLSALIAPMATAGTMGPEEPTMRWVAMLSGGAVWADAGKTQTFFLAPGVEKAYVANANTNALAEGEIFLGFQKSVMNKTEGQLGIEVATTGNAKASGQVWDDADARFNNYTYKYDIEDTRIIVKGRLLRDLDHQALKIYGHAGLGVAFNNAHNFTSTPTIFEAVATSNFASNTETAFTYTFGAGLQRVLNNNWQVGVGYEFADWGKSQLGRAAGQTMNSGLSLSHLYTNGILANITYLK